MKLYGMYEIRTNSARCLYAERYIYIYIYIDYKQFVNHIFQVCLYIYIFIYIYPYIYIYILYIYIYIYIYI